MTDWHGKFVWYDLMTSDLKAAEAFYQHVVGWKMADAEMPDRSYTVLSAGDAMVGGLMPIPPEAAAHGAPPVWFGYIAVHDVDEYSEKVRAAGGAVHRAPDDIPNIGRFAVVADPGGAAFILFKGMTSGDHPQPDTNAPGQIGWRELRAADGPSAFAFYSGLFGWAKTEAMDMGPMGTYQMFGTGGPTVGAVMTRPSPDMPAHWMYYFNVDAIDAAIARVTEKGGKVVNGPMEVPGGQWVANCVDPQGAVFSMVAPGR